MFVTSPPPLHVHVLNASVAVLFALNNMETNDHSEDKPLSLTQQAIPVAVSIASAGLSASCTQGLCGSADSVAAILLKRA